MTNRKAKGEGYKLYVGGLGEGADQDEIREAFESFGSLAHLWVARQPSGFAFVVFERHRDAEEAVRCLDGTLMNNRRVRVEFSTGESRWSKWKIDPPIEKRGVTLKLMDVLSGKDHLIEARTPASYERNNIRSISHISSSSSSSSSSSVSILRNSSRSNCRPPDYTDRSARRCRSKNPVKTKASVTRSLNKAQSRASWRYKSLTRHKSSRSQKKHRSN